MSASRKPGGQIRGTVRRRAAAEAGSATTPLAVACTEGIDVSAYQKTIDWTQVAAAGIGYCFIKATEGATWQDPLFQQNWQGAAKAQLVRGGYHYFDPAVPVDKQLDNITTMLSLAPGDLAPVVDLESGQNWAALQPSQRLPACLELLQQLEQHYGIRPIVYTNGNTINTVFAGQPGGLANYPLWVASWTDFPPMLPVGWKDWTHWQYTGHGAVAGITVEVDRDRCVGAPGPRLPPKP